MLSSMTKSSQHAWQPEPSLLTNSLAMSQAGGACPVRDLIYKLTMSGIVTHCELVDLLFSIDFVLIMNL